MKIFFLIFILIKLLTANESQCDNKNFLLSLLSTNAKWYPIATNISNGYAPFIAIQSKNGSFSVITPGSDYILRHIGVNYTVTGEEKVILQSTRHYRSEISKKYKKFYNKKIILQPYKNDCNLKNIILEVYMEDTNLSNIKKEIFLYTKMKKSEKIYYGLDPKPLKLFNSLNTNQ